MRSSVPASTPAETHAPLPAAVERFIAATNAHDGDAQAASFAPDAFVNDAGREFWGIDAIRSLLDREIVDAKVTMDVIEVLEHYGDVTVRAVIDGDFDRTGLPDPLVLTFYFTVRDDRIARLIIVLVPAEA